MFSWPESTRFWMVIGCINITITVVTIWKTQTGVFNRATALFTCWICFVLFNTGYLLYVRVWDRRMERHRVRGMVALAIALALVVGLSTTAYLNSYAPKNSYFALAMSNTPLDSIQPVRRRIVVELIRKRAAASKEYESAASHIPPITPPLYSPESFGSIEAMNSAVQQLQQAFDIDTAYFNGLKQSDARFRGEMEQADPQHLQSWLSFQNSEEEAQVSVFTAEDQWVQSVHDLYKYASSQHQNIMVRGGILDFSSSEVRSKFQSVESTSESLQQKMQSARAALVENQRQAKAKVSD